MRRRNRQFVAVTLISALGAGGCNIAPDYPVLEGDDGLSSLSRTSEAAAEGKAKDSAEMAPEKPAPDGPAQKELSQKVPDDASDNGPDDRILAR
ncbi:MAG: hypothetical protein ABJP34_09680 [Erythrobacter sp.]